MPITSRNIDLGALGYMIGVCGAMRVSSCYIAMFIETRENTMSKRLAWGLALGMMGSAGTASAVGNISALDAIGQDAFKAISQDMGAAIGYKAMGDAEPLGIIGFDVGVALTVTSLEASNVWGDAMDSSNLNSLIMPKLYAKKGLPFGIDLGAYYMKVPSTNIEVWGGEIKYAILDGTMATPALAVRGTMSKLEGVEQWEMSTTGLDISLSKGILMLTPYIGIGQQWTTSTPLGSAATAGLTEEKFSEQRMYAGVGLGLLLVNLTAEYEVMGDNSSITLKAGVKF